MIPYLAVAVDSRVHFVKDVGPMLAPMTIHQWDNPGTLRLRKYATGSDVLAEFLDLPVESTPKQLIWARDKARLYRYTTDGGSPRHRVPILIVYSLVLRSYILDLVPGMSVVEDLSRAGFEVFLLDFGVPDKGDCARMLDDYVLDYIPGAVQATRESARAEVINLLGVCMGGTLAASYAASPGAEALRTLVLLSAPIDFGRRAAGLLGLATRSLDPGWLTGSSENFAGDVLWRHLGARTKFVAGLGRQLHMQASLAPSLGKRRDLQTWLAACRWVDDSIPFPGKAFQQWIRDFYHDNKLARGQLTLGGLPIDLAKIRCPVLSVGGVKDAVAPPTQTQAITELVGSQERQRIVLDAGHLGLLVGPFAQRVTWPAVQAWLEPYSR